MLTEESFLEEQLTDILQEVEDQKAHLYYSDGVHPTHQTQTGYGWIKKGKDYELPANTGRKRVNINACINAKSLTDVVYNHLIASMQILLKIYLNNSLVNTVLTSLFM